MEKIFVDGLRFEEPAETAPDFIKGRISIKADELIAFCQKHKNEKGWLNVDLKESKGGKKYFELNTWKPKTQQMASNPITELPKIEYPTAEAEGIRPEDTPF